MSVRYVPICQCWWHQFWARASFRLACMGPGFAGQNIEAFIRNWLPWIRHTVVREELEIRDDWHSTQRAATVNRERAFRYRVTLLTRLGAGLVEDGTWHRRFYFTAARKAGHLIR